MYLFLDGFIYFFLYILMCYVFRSFVLSVVRPYFMYVVRSLSSSLFISLFRYVVLSLFSASVIY